MFNVYQFDKQDKQDDRMLKKWASKDATKSKLVGSVIGSKSQKSNRDRLVTNYKTRITSFIQTMAVKPVEESDYYGKGFSQIEH